TTGAAVRLLSPSAASSAAASASRKALVAGMAVLAAKAVAVACVHDAGRAGRDGGGGGGDALAEDDRVRDSLWYRFVRLLYPRMDRALAQRQTVALAGSYLAGLYLLLWIFVYVYAAGSNAVLRGSVHPALLLGRVGSTAGSRWTSLWRGGWASVRTLWLGVIPAMWLALVAAEESLIARMMYGYQDVHLVPASRAACDESAECPICQGVADADVGKVLYTFCDVPSHGFHYECLNRWFESGSPAASRCPLCRGGLRVLGVHVDSFASLLALPRYVYGLAARAGLTAAGLTAAGLGASLQELAADSALRNVRLGAWFPA
ncbi:uncharacterized protein AMSG_03120, partial [Thecamonas trahens ATCC 50062]